MAELAFGCAGAHSERYAATPTLTFSLQITEATGVAVHAIALRCQIRIEPHRRRYSADEARMLPGCLQRPRVPLALAGWCGFAWYVFWQGTAGTPVIWSARPTTASTWLWRRSAMG